MLKDITPRLYQETILATCVTNNTLVVLPTGMGKTVVSLMLAAQRLKQYPGTKILVLAPTRPLVEQHLQTFKTSFEIDHDKLAFFTGMVKPEKRAEDWKSASIIFSTPQGLENDILSSRINLKDVSLLVFDEAHRAVGDYAYVYLCKKFCSQSKCPRVLGLTASPGSDLDTILEVCKNLYIEDVEVRTEEDPDVKPYIQDVQVNYVYVTLPDEFLAIKKYLDDFVKEKLTLVKKFGIINTTSLNKSQLIKLQGFLHGQIARGEKDFDMLKSLSVIAEVMKVQHALELLESQGISMLISYIEKLEKESVTSKVKAVRNLVKDLSFRSAAIKARLLKEKNIDHPKLDKLKELVKEELCSSPENKLIVFTQYRDSAEKIKEILDTLSITSEIFVGQAKKGTKKGLTQKRQIELMNEFRLGLFSVLIATSVAEEGLDIPKVDSVIFYEPIPSAIRHIQRRGRTGRLEKGNVTVLVAKNTRDEGYRWSAFHKEKRMHRLLKNLKSKIKFNMEAQQTVESFSKSEFRVYVDYREKGSNVMKQLSEMKADIQLQKLESADYVLSQRVGVEFKTVPDFISSIIDGRLFSQLNQLRQTYPRPVVIIEGQEDLYSVRKIHPNSIRGAIATIMIGYGIPLFQTKDAHETANLLKIIAKREQDPKKSYFDTHQERKPLTLKEQQEYIVSSLPNIGPALAKPLLKHFKSIKAIVSAKEEELKQVELIGPLKAKKIREVFDSVYSD